MADDGGDAPVMPVEEAEAPAAEEPVEEAAPPDAGEAEAAPAAEEAEPAPAMGSEEPPAVEAAAAEADPDAAPAEDAEGGAATAASPAEEAAPEAAVEGDGDAAPADAAFPSEGGRASPEGEESVAASVPAAEAEEDTTMELNSQLGSQALRDWAAMHDEEVEKLQQQLQEKDDKAEAEKLRQALAKSELEATLAESRQSEKDLRQELKTLQAEAKRIRNEDKVEQQLRETIASLELDAGKLKDCMKEQKDCMQAQNQQLSDNIRQLKQDCTHVYNEKNILQKSLAECEEKKNARILHLTNKAQAAEQMSLAHKQSLEEKTETLQRLQSALANEREHFQQALANERAEKVVLLEDLEAKTASLAALSKDKRQLQCELNNAKSSLLSVEEERDRVYDEMQDVADAYTSFLDQKEVCRLPERSGSSGSSGMAVHKSSRKGQLSSSSSH